jgi:hypothetical protein
MPIEVKSFASQADEAKDMPNARMEAVNAFSQCREAPSVIEVNHVQFKN